ncbi:hypothetical protein JKY72_05485 [Candidatus Gracilibacteria bacterium]|nr:hypothetical protein [Candidatus Gracilibacteria bacterium]
MDIVTLMGTTGAIIILIAFALNQTQVWHRDFFIYDLFNAVGAAIMVVYASFIGATPFIFLNAIWMTLAIRDLFTDYDRNEKSHKRGFFNKWMK